MAKIANVASTNTFDAWRSRSNVSFDRLSQFAINNSSLYANTITANVTFTSTGLATLSGRATVGTNLTVSGNTTLGAAGKTITTTGAAAHTGTKTISTNLTVSGNTALGATTISGLLTQAAGADIASAATINLSTATGNGCRITGNTAISAVTMNTGQQVLIVASAALPLTYNATTNKLNSAGASVTLAAGDMVLYSKDLSGIVHGNIIKADGTSVVAASGGVTSIVAGTGITVSGATGAVTVNTIVSSGGVGTYMNAFTSGSSTSPTRGSTYAGSTLGAFYISGCCAPFATFGFSGTWRAVSPAGFLTGNPGNGSAYYQQSGLTTTRTGNESYWMFQRIV